MAENRKKEVVFLCIIVAGVNVRIPEHQNSNWATTTNWNILILSPKCLGVNSGVIFKKRKRTISILAWRSRQCVASGVRYPGNTCLLRLIVLPRWSAWPSSLSARMICCCCCLHFFPSARQRGNEGV